MLAHGFDARLARIVGDEERMPLAQGSVGLHEDTPPALFLPGPGNTYPITGHQGNFSEGEFTRLIEKEGFRDIVEHYGRYAWVFPDEDTMIEFCKQLFGLMRGTRRQVSEAIHRYLAVEVASGGSVSCIDR